jgi:N-acetyltransferase 10
MGYGSRALQALNSFYSGEYFNLDESPKPDAHYPDAAAIDPVGFFVPIDRFLELTFCLQNADLLSETPTVRAPSAMPPLLQRLTERKPENLDYLGVSYGLTSSLLR